MSEINFEVIARVVEIASIIGAGGLVIFKLGRAMEKFEVIGSQQAKEITELKDGVRTIGDLVTRMAVSNTRQDTFAERLGRMESQLDEMRHGDGFIKNGKRGIDREYP